MLLIDPKERSRHLSTLATLYLPDLHILLTSSGREIGHCGTALAGKSIEQLAPVAPT